MSSNNRINDLPERLVTMLRARYKCYGITQEAQLRFRAIRVRQGIRSLLAVRPEWKVCGEAATGREAIEKVKRLLGKIHDKPGEQLRIAVVKLASPAPPLILQFHGIRRN